VTALAPLATIGTGTDQVRIIEEETVPLFADFRADVPVLYGERVQLEPLSEAHAADLAVAAEEDRAAYGFTVVPRADEVGELIAAHLERAKTVGMVPFAQVRVSDGRAAGITTYWDPRFWPDRPDELCALEIGWTWLAASAQRTGINTEAKFLLLTCAFETLRVARVDLKTDARNKRSWRAIEGIGAKHEGVLRSWSPSRVPGEEGRMRDSAIFSVVTAEWPEVKAGLRRKLDRRGSGLAGCSS
jgi:N-acetyltransferase